MLEHGEPEVRERELARGAQQKPFAELRFEGGNPSRDRRLRKAEALRGARKAAFIRDTREHQEVIGLEIHAACLLTVLRPLARRWKVRDCCCHGTMISILMASASSQ